MTNTDTNPSLADDLKALAAWRHALDTCEPLTAGQAKQISLTIQTNLTQRDMLVDLVVDPGLPEEDINAYLADPDPASPLGMRLGDSFSRPPRPVPSDRIDHAASLLDRIAAARPAQQAQPHAIQATLYWLAERYAQAQEKALTALDDDPSNRLADLVRQLVAFGAPSPWSRIR